MGTMGDTAEAIFEDVYPEGFARYGLSRPPVKVGELPAKFRFTPDYLTSKGLVEVQGFGRDQTVKLKLDKFSALGQWHADWRVDLFLWDSHKKRYGWLSWPALQGLIDEGCATLGYFHDPKAYLAFKAADIPCEWVKHTPDKAA